MNRVHILVEGQTEESFVNNVLKPYFEPKGIYITPIIISTKRIKSGLKFKGGVTKYSHVKDDLRKLLKDTSSVLVTTMIDYYGLPTDFPGYESYEKNKNTVRSRHLYLEGAFKKDIDSIKFYPYLVKHEFEGLLFSNPEEIAKKVLPKSKTTDLQKIRASFQTPEDINNHPSTAPSKRIVNIFPDYEKVADGPIIAQRIGLNAIRVECRHFNQWIEHIENKCSS